MAVEAAVVVGAEGAGATEVLRMELAHGSNPTEFTPLTRCQCRLSWLCTTMVCLYHVGLFVEFEKERTPLTLVVLSQTDSALFFLLNCEFWRFALLVLPSIHN